MGAGTREIAPIGDPYWEDELELTCSAVFRALSMQQALWKLSVAEGSSWPLAEIAPVLPTRELASQPLAAKISSRAGPQERTTGHHPSGVIQGLKTRHWEWPLTKWGGHCSTSCT
jgi:hypothetical protein